ncbi:MAG: hypothetical protein EAZ91_01630 [Cytophagales bacterium]|nr:MAG: hypothetical protein EAZ91_01630 [Cytophagales bacterium]
MFVQKNFLFIVIALAVVFAVAMRATIFQKPTASSSASGGSTPKAFLEYWFAGKAEISSYRLEQAQYGALNPGSAVLIFVTEDFRTDTQVKSESPDTRDKSTPVLKTNLVRKCLTGIYDYSMFTSVFTPIETAKFPRTLKVSTSVQEWCGHSYVQLNLRNTGYAVSSRSYFENEATEDYSVGVALLEDELWNRIRLSPDKLPTGDVSVVPSSASGRLRHRKLDPLPATAQMGPYSGNAFAGAGLQAYTLTYTGDGTRLMVVFEGAFPHRIVGWEETVKQKDKLLTSRAVLQKTILSDYWNHNAPGDSVLRKELGL